jgi:hypothetical protein
MVAVADPGVLALVIHDPLAPKILAWWDVTKPRAPKKLELVGADPPSPPAAVSILTKVQLLALCRISASTPEQIESTLERCDLAGLFAYDGSGITDMARKWLGSHVAMQIGLARRRDSRKDERGSIVLAVALGLVALAGSAFAIAWIRDCSHATDLDRSS